MRAKVHTVLCVTFLVLEASAQAQAQPEPLRYARIYADSTGASHFADDAMALALINPGRGIPPTPASALTAATGLLFLCPASGGIGDWHPAPRRQSNFIVSGEVDVEVSDGEVRRFGPGSVILLEDTEGEGHRTRVVGSDRACFVGVSLAEQ